MYIYVYILSIRSKVTCTCFLIHLFYYLIVRLFVPFFKVAITREHFIAKLDAYESKNGRDRSVKEITLKLPLQNYSFDVYKRGVKDSHIKQTDQPGAGFITLSLTVPKAANMGGLS